MTSLPFPARRWLACGLLLATVALGCEKTTRPSRFVSMGTAPVGGVFAVMGNAIAEVLNEQRGDNEWRIQTKGTKGSQENIRRLSRGDLQLAISNAAISYFGFRGEAGWEQAYEIRAVMTLAPNVALFITKSDSGIRTIADLRGKNVVIGPAGAGFEQFVEPILREHGLTLADVRAVNATQSAAVDLLGDGSVDAAFLGGAVPTASIAQACTSFDVRFIPFDEDARQRLIEKYPFFQEAIVPAVNDKGQATYRGMTEDFRGLNVGSMHLITSAEASDELVYQVAKTMWEHREQIAQKHPAGRAINPRNAPRYTGVPFHPGAERYFREIGVWPESPGMSSPAAAPPASTAPPATTTSAAGP